DLPTASFGSSQAPTDAVDKSPSASNTKIQTAPFTHAAPGAENFNLTLCCHVRTPSFETPICLGMIPG
ncbi:hypothetical protein, partial [Thiomonas bhubaneswarensis]|uniref:hypothetical protein n=1 Tax=Thiomonas bhubaneswarensis TaxID=339866 RepID=UPI001B808918